jgi:Magnesium transporter NIPA
MPRVVTHHILLRLTVTHFLKTQYGGQECRHVSHSRILLDDPTNVLHFTFPVAIGEGASINACVCTRDTDFMFKVANFAAYTFAPPILVTSLGTLSVLIG